MRKSVTLIFGSQIANLSEVIWPSEAAANAAHNENVSCVFVYLFLSFLVF